jgi:hypothetical protein
MATDAFRHQTPMKPGAWGHAAPGSRDAIFTDSGRPAVGTRPVSVVPSGTLIEETDFPPLGRGDAPTSAACQ